MPAAQVVHDSNIAQDANIILDTNIVLDLFVFKDPATAPLLDALHSGRLRWLATAPMRQELERVLDYPQIAKRRAFYQITPAQVMAQFDGLAQLTEVAAKAPVTCKDPDDQKFIDLAVCHRALVLSKDQAVLCMAKRLITLGSTAQAAIKIIAS
jgi:putative PIN family toxin of toxin-antitoxin system